MFILIIPEPNDNELKSNHDIKACDCCVCLRSTRVTL